MLVQRLVGGTCAKRGRPREPVPAPLITASRRCPEGTCAKKGSHGDPIADPLLMYSARNALGKAGASTPKTHSEFQYMTRDIFVNPGHGGLDSKTDCSRRGNNNYRELVRLFINFLGTFSLIFPKTCSLTFYRKFLLTSPFRLRTKLRV